MTDLEEFRLELIRALPKLSPKRRPFAENILKIINGILDGTGNPDNLQERILAQLRGMINV